MDPAREKRPHQSKFIKQLCYYTIVVILQLRSAFSIFSRNIKCLLSLTVVIILLTSREQNIELIDTDGIPLEIPVSTFLQTLGIGWAAFGLSLIFNILYYALHPSQVNRHSLILFEHSWTLLQVNLLNINEKLVVALFGYEINLVDRTSKGEVT